MEDILYRSRCGKTNVKILSPKKIYAVDLGVRTLYTGFRDIGSLFENYVYLKIKHLNPCYVYEDGSEIDTFDGAKLRFLNRGKKRRSVSTLSIPRASDRGAEWVDFLTSEKTLIEVKDHSQMTKKQQNLFNIYPAKKKGS
jgi:hypothetical protein